MWPIGAAPAFAAATINDASVLAKGPRLHARCFCARQIRLVRNIRIGGVVCYGWSRWFVRFWSDRADGSAPLQTAQMGTNCVCGYRLMHRWSKRIALCSVCAVAGGPSATVLAESLLSVSFVQEQKSVLSAQMYCDLFHLCRLLTHKLSVYNAQMGLTAVRLARTSVSARQKQMNDLFPHRWNRRESDRWVRNGQLFWSVCFCLALLLFWLVFYIAVEPPTPRDLAALVLLEGT